MTNGSKRRASRRASKRRANEERANEERAASNTTPRAQMAPEAAVGGLDMMWLRYQNDRMKERDLQLAKMVDYGEESMKAKSAIRDMKKLLQILQGGTHQQIISKSIEAMETLLHTLAIAKQLALDRICGQPPPHPEADHPFE